MVNIVHKQKKGRDAAKEFRGIAAQFPAFPSIRGWGDESKIALTRVAILAGLVLLRNRNTHAGFAKRAEHFGSLALLLRLF